MDPGGHAYPAAHEPLHVADDAPGVDPYTPPGQSMHTPAPDSAYFPATHRLAVGDAEPAGHAYPAVQFPLHNTDTRPDTDPNVPAGHGPLQADDDSPKLLPYVPTGQLTHTPAPPTLYFPATHTLAVELADPAGHAYPALHAPLQA